jgi:hypothetical protein
MEITRYTLPDIPAPLPCGAWGMRTHPSNLKTIELDPNRHRAGAAGCRMGRLIARVAKAKRAKWPCSRRRWRWNQGVQNPARSWLCERASPSHGDLARCGEGHERHYDKRCPIRPCPTVWEWERGPAGRRVDSARKTNPLVRGPAAAGWGLLSPIGAISGGRRRELIRGQHSRAVPVITVQVLPYKGSGVLGPPHLLLRI